MRIPRRDHLNAGATSLDAALVGAGADVATPPLARLGVELRLIDFGPAASFRFDLRRQLVTAAPTTARRSQPATP